MADCLKLKHCYRPESNVEFGVHWKLPKRGSSLRRKRRSNKTKRTKRKKSKKRKKRKKSKKSKGGYKKSKNKYKKGGAMIDALPYDISEKIVSHIPAARERASSAARERAAEEAEAAFPTGYYVCEFSGFPSWGKLIKDVIIYCERTKNFTDTLLSQKYLFCEKIYNLWGQQQNNPIMDFSQALNGDFPHYIAAKIERIDIVMNYTKTGRFPATDKGVWDNKTNEIIWRSGSKWKLINFTPPDSLTDCETKLAALIHKRIPYPRILDKMKKRYGCKLE